MIIRCFDVGQGNSVLIEIPPDGEHPNPRFGIIDCFYRKAYESEPRVLSYLKRRQIQELEFIVLSHADDDHVSGLGLVLDHFSTGKRTFKTFVESFYDCRYAASRIGTRRMRSGDTLTPHGQELDRIASRTVDLVARGKTAFRYAASRVAFDEFDLTDDVSMRFFAPSENAFARFKREAGTTLTAAVGGGGVPPLTLNDGCLAFQLTYGDAKVLFCGDVTNRVWTEIMPEVSRRNVSLESDFILVTHHGSEQGNPSALWERVKRRTRTSIAMISCGYKNRYKHPSTKTLNRILFNQISLYCTNLGFPCLNYKVMTEQPKTLFEEAIEQASRPLADRALAEIATPVSEICSGDCEFEVSKQGVVVVRQREQESHCEYARRHSFNNPYPVAPLYGRLI